MDPKLREKLIDQLSEWINASVIAGALVEAMAEVALDEEMTLDKAKAIYFDFLSSELHNGLKRSVLHR